VVVPIHLPTSYASGMILNQLPFESQNTTTSDQHFVLGLFSSQQNSYAGQRINRLSAAKQLTARAVVLYWLL
jgi:hypothetical protein